MLLAGVVYWMPNAVWPATYAEYFPTSVRLSGMAIGTQFGFALAGFTPTIAGALMAGDADNWDRVAAFAVGCLRHLRDRRRSPAPATPTVADPHSGPPSRAARRACAWRRHERRAVSPTARRADVAPSGWSARASPPR